MFFYRFHIGDYAKLANHLTPLEDIAFRRLLDLYITEDELPVRLVGTAASLAKKIRMRDHEKDVADVLAEFFSPTDGGFSCAFADQILSEIYARSEAARVGGKASAQARNQRKVNGKSTDVEHPLKNTQRDTNERSSFVEENPTGSQLPSTQYPVPSTQRKEREPRATRLPTPFELPPEYREFCERERPDLDPDRVAAKFADYWHGKGGAAGRKTDWLATWRNWVREERGGGRDFAPSATAKKQLDWPMI